MNEGAAFWDAWDRVQTGAAGAGAPWSRDLQDAALALAPHPAGHPRDYYARRRAERAERQAREPAPAAPQTSRQRRPIGMAERFQALDQPSGEAAYARLNRVDANLRQVLKAELDRGGVDFVLV